MSRNKHNSLFSSVGTGKMQQEATVVVSCGLAVKCIDQGWIRDEGLILQPPKQDKAIHNQMLKVNFK